jgi:hypothetical protein
LCVKVHYMHRVELVLAALAVSALVGSRAVAADSPAPAPAPVPVSVFVTGSGSIRLIVAEGTERTCDSPGNHLLYNGRAKAGDEVKLVAPGGAASICVDHTYGTFRDSQWAGGVFWSAGDFGSGAPHARLVIRVSTDAP